MEIQTDQKKSKLFKFLESVDETLTSLEKLKNVSR